MAVAATASAVAGLGALGGDDQEQVMQAGAESTTSTQPSSTTTVTATPTTATTRPPTTTTQPPAPAGGASLLAQLRRAPEPARAGYDRDLFPYPIDADGDRCNTREEVLIAESSTLAQVDHFGCTVVAGDWFSLYDGVHTEQPGDIEIDHVVALAEAWDSGANLWDADRRRAFANDLDFGGSLIAVTGTSNQQKSDQDPGEWLPTRRDAWCGFATDWLSVKVRWDLSADDREIDALRTALGTCAGPPSTTVPTVPATTPTTVAPPPSPGGTAALVVAALDCGGEAVTVTNTGAGQAGLAGWTIHDEGTKHTFSFPSGVQLPAGASVTVRSGGPAGPGEFDLDRRVRLEQHRRHRLSGGPCRRPDVGASLLDVAGPLAFVSRRWSLSARYRRRPARTPYRLPLGDGGWAGLMFAGRRRRSVIHEVPAMSVAFPAAEPSESSLRPGCGECPPLSCGRLPARVVMSTPQRRCYRRSVQRRCPRPWSRVHSSERRE